MSDLEIQVRTLIELARRMTRGTMDPLWDDIFEARALLTGQHTFVKYKSREEGLLKIKNALTEMVQKRVKTI